MNGYLNRWLNKSGGLFGKLGQLTNGHRPESDLFGNNVSLNSESTVAILFNFLITRLPDQLHDADLRPFKQGTVGQVHQGQLVEGKKRVVFKVVYVGIEDKFKKHFKTLGFFVDFAKRIGFSLGNVIEECKELFLEEINLEIELKNQTRLRSCWRSSKWLNIPQCYPEFSCKTIMCSEFCAGTPLGEYLGTASQADLDQLTFWISEFIFTNHLKFDCFFTDIHYGNFLVSYSPLCLHVVDFGSVKYFAPGFTQKIKQLYASLIRDDIESFTDIVLALGMIKHKKNNHVAELYKFYLVQCEPWIKPSTFTFTQEWYTRSFSSASLIDLLTWNLPPGIVWFARICFGMNKMFTKMNASGDFFKILNRLLP